MGEQIFSAVACAAIGYLLGMINPAYLIAKMKGFDIREAGSGNAGASNAVITMGKAVGIFAAVFDIAKAYAAVKLAKLLFPAFLFARELAGFFAILGHIFPATMGFRGGKGLASLAGTILAFDLRAAGLLFLAELILVLVIDFICVAPLTMSSAFPFVYYALTGQIFGALLFALLIPIFFWKHIENLKRIREGKELHFSFLWRKKEELDRVTRNNND